MIVADSPLTVLIGVLRRYLRCPQHDQGRYIPFPVRRGDDVSGKAMAFIPGVVHLRPSTGKKEKESLGGVRFVLHRTWLLYSSR